MPLECDTGLFDCWCLLLSLHCLPHPGVQHMLPVPVLLPAHGNTLLYPRPRGPAGTGAVKSNWNMEFRILI